MVFCLTLNFMSLIIFTGRQCKLKVHQEERLAKYLKYKAAIGSEFLVMVYDLSSKRFLMKLKKTEVSERKLTNIIFFRRIGVTQTIFINVMM